MNIAIKIFLFVLVTAITTTIEATTVNIKGKEYKTVRIGNQIWLAENLNYEVSGSNCYDDDSSYCAKYGRLYNWEAAKKVALEISGWHLPTDEEWKTLEKTLGMSQSERDDWGDRGTNQGTQLKKGGSSGFTALLTGCRSLDGTFINLDNYAYFWSASPSVSSDAWNRTIFRGHETVNRYTNFVAYQFSVRLVKD